MPPSILLQQRQQLDLNDCIDAAVFTCLTTAFYASAQLEEFTVCRLEGFDPEKSITQNHLTYGEDHNRLKVTTLCLPETKTSNTGEDVFWATQTGLTNPEAVLQHHLGVNDPPDNQHLFAYHYKTGHRPLTKTKFIEWLAKASRNAGVEMLGYVICHLSVLVTDVGLLSHHGLTLGGLTLGIRMILR